MNEALKIPTDMQKEDYVKMTAEIVAATAQHKHIEDMTAFIQEVFTALTALDTSKAEDHKGLIENKKKKSAKQLHKETVTPDYIICLEDGKKLKMLKRHLKAFYNMTPAEYIKKWGLEADYPFTAVNYSKSRTEIAKKFKLGSIRRKPRVENV